MNQRVANRVTVSTIAMQLNLQQVIATGIIPAKTVSCISCLSWTTAFSGINVSGMQNSYNVPRYFERISCEIKTCIAGSACADLRCGIRIRRALV